MCPKRFKLLAQTVLDYETSNYTTSIEKCFFWEHSHMIFSPQTGENSMDSSVNNLIFQCSTDDFYDLVCIVDSASDLETDSCVGIVNRRFIELKLLQN